MEVNKDNFKGILEGISEALYLEYKDLGNQCHEERSKIWKMEMKLSDKKKNLTHLKNRRGEIVDLYFKLTGQKLFNLV